MIEISTYSFLYGLRWSFSSSIFCRGGRLAIPRTHNLLILPDGVPWHSFGYAYSLAMPTMAIDLPPAMLLAFLCLCFLLAVGHRHSVSRGFKMGKKWIADFDIIILPMFLDIKCIVYFWKIKNIGFIALHNLFGLKKLKIDCVFLSSENSSIFSHQLLRDNPIQT
jgi:hypothetical protein